MVLNLQKLSIQNHLIDNLKEVRDMITKLKTLIKTGENLTTEFKESKSKLIKDISQELGLIK